MAKRKGLGKGRGKGYENLLPRDKPIHSDSAKGIKQPQKIPQSMANIEQNPEDLSWGQMEKRYGELKVEDFEIENITPDFFGEDITASIDADGDIKYPHGLGGAIEEAGGNKVSKSEIKKILAEVFDEIMEEKAEHETEDDVIEQTLNFKQDNNTYNYDPPLAEIYNYGVFKTEDERTFISFKTHLGGDVRGNYADSVLYDITDIDTGATGEPEGDIIVLLSPRVSITGNFKGKRADYEYMGGGDGFDTADTDQPDIEGNFGDFYDKYEQFAKENFK